MDRHSAVQVPVLALHPLQRRIRTEAKRESQKNMTGGASGWQRSRKSKRMRPGLITVRAPVQVPGPGSTENPAGLVWLRLFHCRRPHQLATLPALCCRLPGSCSQVHCTNASNKHQHHPAGPPFPPCLCRLSSSQTTSLITPPAPQLRSAFCSVSVVLCTLHGVFPPQLC